MCRVVTIINFFPAFKIFSIDDGTFIEDLDLRGNDTVNLNYSFTDVSWNLKEGKTL